MSKSKNKRLAAMGKKQKSNFWMERTQQESDKVYDRIVGGKRVKMHVGANTLIEYLNAQRQFLINVYPELPVDTMPIEKLELLILDFGAFVQSLQEK